MNNQNKQDNVIELRQFNAVSIRQLEDICKGIRASVDDINTIVPTTSVEKIMYSAGVHYALNRLLSIVKTSNIQKG